ncbi:putative bifunctional diguanylate cyclase/phosphodiesterase [Methyloradius palustris]|uniref:putative bifunctional diguanylate cyclase/phosphodiesterase n=1 Tax=Methyloradius palustris TaxID=2778876 RepID=UPI001CED806F|nr:EAL domain-containing protein [Methyloradius palustris]
MCDQVRGSDAEYASAMAAGIRAVMSDKTSEFSLEYPCHSPVEKRWFVCRVASFCHENAFRILMTHEDVTKTKLAEIELNFQNQEKEKRALELIIANNELSIAATAFQSQGGILVTDANRVILRVNRAFTTITGYSEQELIGETSHLLRTDLDDTTFHHEMWQVVNKTGEWAGEIWSHRKNGDMYPEQITVTAAKDANGKVTNYIVNLTDITLSKAAAEEIQQLAFYDPLTKLPNRRLLVDRIKHALATSGRAGWVGALLFIDLDHFKTLNDTLGHDSGDLLLQQVSARLIDSVRECDTVARIGGDEFVVLIEGLSQHAIESAAETQVIADKIHATLNEPYQLGLDQYYSSPSIGVTLFQDQLLGIEELLQQADIAMYQAKKAGRNDIRFFDQQMQDTINARASMEKDLHKALEREQFQLYYQVQVNSSRQVVGAEGLIRWVHPKRGLVSPCDFISLAEETGLILPIGEWVLDTACAQLKAWQQDETTHQLTISVNVSTKQCRQSDFVALVKTSANKFDINPALLKLELTESILLENVEDIIATMQELKEVGIHFSLDDFGTGYSSLQYLKQLPLHQLKIDQSFVRNIAIDHSDQAIVRTIIAMASSLELNVIAEGVETEEQQKFLQKNHCNHYQGYLFGKPSPIDQFEVLLK